MGHSVALGQVVARSCWVQETGFEGRVDQLLHCLDWSRNRNKNLDLEHWPQALAW